MLVTWLPIATAPKDGTRVLASDGAELSIAAWRVTDGVGWWTCEAYPQQCASGAGAEHGFWEAPPIKWMPLPQP